MRLIRLIDNWWECEICGDLYRYKKDALLVCGSNCAHLKANKKIHVVSNSSLNRALGGLNMTPKGLCDYILSGKIYDHIPSGDSNSEEMDRYIWPARMKHLVELAKIAYPIYFGKD